MQHRAHLSVSIFSCTEHIYPCPFSVAQVLCFLYGWTVSLRSWEKDMNRKSEWQLHYWPISSTENTFLLVHSRNQSFQLLLKQRFSVQSIIFLTSDTKNSNHTFSLFKKNKKYGHVFDQQPQTCLLTEMPRLVLSKSIEEVKWVPCDFCSPGSVQSAYSPLFTAVLSLRCL